MAGVGGRLSQAFAVLAVEALLEHKKHCKFKPGAEDAAMKAGMEAGRIVGKLIDSYETECSLEHGNAG
jgi:hypothetical protein